MAHRRMVPIEPLLKIMRDKVIRAVDEVVSRHHREHLDELRAETRRLSDELRETRNDMFRLFERLEINSRRDLLVAAERAAVASSEEFIRATMPKAPDFPDMQATLEYGLGLAPADGLALEFGVYSGSTLKTIAAARSGGVYGFDSFDGLPETWRNRFPAGEFAMDGPPEVPGAEIVVGWFSDTLPGFMAEHGDEPIAFVHVDCDLYSSTVTVLEHVGPRLRPGSVLVFDEYLNFPGWQDHEHRAWSEFVEARGIGFTYEGYTVDNQQVVVRVTEVPN